MTQRYLDGVLLIKRERDRQWFQEGWDPAHDAVHTNGELVAAAICYAEAGRGFDLEISARDGKWPMLWPWEPSWWKPSDDLVRNLVKAGALIAAEIDRVQRADTPSVAADPAQGERLRDAETARDELQAGLEMWHGKFLAMVETYLTVQEQLTAAESQLTALRQERDEARKEIDAAWFGIEHGFDIETRADLESQARTNGFKYGLAQAVHHMWKRDPRVEELEASVSALTVLREAIREAMKWCPHPEEGEYTASGPVLRLLNGLSAALAVSPVPQYQEKTDGTGGFSIHASEDRG